MFLSSDQINILIVFGRIIIIITGIWVIYLVVKYDLGGALHRTGGALVGIILALVASMVYALVSSEIEFRIVTFPIIGILLILVGRLLLYIDYMFNEEAELRKVRDAVLIAAEETLKMPLNEQDVVHVPVVVLRQPEEMIPIQVKSGNILEVRAEDIVQFPVVVIRASEKVIKVPTSDIVSLPSGKASDRLSVSIKGLGIKNTKNNHD